ncbi:MAG: WXG100 family type VII secretion target [Anaerolineae bacterium]|jgi:WXG100 family type VII secretion target|nr:WXG100 family type VII secretion target [Anaerolineae bacterium]
MSDLIRVPYTELLHRASRIRQEAETIRREIVSLKSTFEGLGWMGRRAERFFALWNDTAPEMEQWATVLERFADELEDQARRMQIADEAF